MVKANEAFHLDTANKEQRVNKYARQLYTAQLTFSKVDVPNHSGSWDADCSHNGKPLQRHR